MNIFNCKKQIVATLILMMFMALALLPLRASGDQELSENVRDSDPVFMLSLSLGIAPFHFRGYRGSTTGTSFGMSYIKDHHFFGVRTVSASFYPHMYGNDLSLLYGRAYIDDHSFFSIASGVGYSTFYRSLGLPIDIKLLGLLSRRSGVSLGVHGFAFLTSSNQYFGICLNLGLIIRGR